MPTIQEIVRARGIKFLVHFTRVENLASILEHGLVPRADFESLEIDALVCDEIRLDNCYGATSLSISFPNYKMFYPSRIQQERSQWAVIVLKPRVLWTHKCAFCVENAAKASVSRLSIKERMGGDALEALFAEAENRPSRATLAISEDMPTNPQAEVLAFGTISPADFIGVAFDQQALVNEYKNRFPKFDFKAVGVLFKPRRDYSHWK